MRDRLASILAFHSLSLSSEEETEEHKLIKGWVVGFVIIAILDNVVFKLLCYNACAVELVAQI